MIEAENLINLYQKIISELCDIIGDKTIDLSDEFEDGDFKYPTIDGYGTCIVKSVYVNRYSNTDLEDNRFLQFDIDILTIGVDGHDECYDSSATFDDIPLTYGLNLLATIYPTIKSLEKKNED